MIFWFSNHVFQTMQTMQKCTRRAFLMQKQEKLSSKHENDLTT